MFVLVAYDIRDNDRLRHVAKVMESYGQRVQRSIFECEVGMETLIVMIAELKAAMHRREDKVYVYRLCDSCRKRVKVSGKLPLMRSVDVFIV